MTSKVEFAAWLGGGVVAVGVAMAAAVAATPGSPGAPPDAGECLRVTISHDEASTGADGVEHRARYRDRMFRCGAMVWTERVLPKGLDFPPEHGHAPHEELPPNAELAKWIQRTPDGKTTLSLVSHALRMVIEVRAEDFESVGFDGSWDGAAHLLKSETLGRMTPSEGRAGERWLAFTKAGRYARVKWSDALGLPLEVHTGTSDRRVTDVLRTEVEAAGASAMPWAHLDGYVRKNLSDFRD